MLALALTLLRLLLPDRTGHADAANDRGLSPCAGISPIAGSEARLADVGSVPVRRRASARQVLTRSRSTGRELRVCGAYFGTIACSSDP
jgi:hypothetical protein